MLNGKLLDILLVDDDETTNFLNSRALKKAGIARSIQITENGKEAIDYLTCKGEFSYLINFPKPDLIFLDMNMPIMNGWEFLEAYSNLEEHTKANVIVVMLTTSLQEHDYNKAKSTAFIKGLVSKPLNQKTLREIISQHLHQLLND